MDDEFHDVNPDWVETDGLDTEFDVPEVSDGVDGWGNVDANRLYHLFVSGHLLLHHEQFASISTGTVKTEITISINDPSYLLAFTNLNPWIDKMFPTSGNGWILAPGAVTNLGTYTSTASAAASYTDAGVMSEFTGTGNILLPANAHAETSE